jgi:hypothetical protein
MVAPQAGQKRDEGSTGLPHFEQNMWVSGRFYFAIGADWRKCNWSLDDILFGRVVRLKASADACGMTTTKAKARTTAKTTADFSAARLTMRL